MERADYSQHSPHYGPPRDRRRRKRRLTLKNFAMSLIALAILFVAVTLISERYGPDPGEHGRLYRQRAETVPVVEAEPVLPVVEATPLTPSVGADPLLLDAAKREQYLGVGVPIPLVTPEVSAASTEYQIVPDRPNLPKLGGGVFRSGDEKEVVVNPPAASKPGAKRKIVISGGADGVELRVDGPGR